MSIVIEQKYIPDYHSPDFLDEKAWVLIYMDKKLLMKWNDGKYLIPEVSDLVEIIPNVNDLVYIGKYDGLSCYCIILSEISILPENMELINPREITKLSGDSGLFLLAGTANHILHWYRVNQYCGCCGHKNEDKKDERAKICPNCGNLVYPRISPATITAVFREDKILLAHNRNFKNNLHSLIAGFTEPGETLEQCVKREIQEEVGIKVKNIRYFGSQPWPFPDSLMIAFTAEYESGEIMVDNSEITSADWYHAESLPEIPTTDSIAGKIIRWYRDKSINKETI